MPPVRFFEGFQVQLSDHVSVVSEITGHFAEQVSLWIGYKQGMLFFLSLKHEVFYEGERFPTSASANCYHMAVDTPLVGIEIHALSALSVKLAKDLSLAFFNRPDLSCVYKFVRILEMRVAVRRSVPAVNEASVELVIPQALLPGLMSTVNCSQGKACEKSREYYQCQSDGKECLYDSKGTESTTCPFRHDQVQKSGGIDGQEKNRKQQAADSLSEAVRPGLGNFNFFFCLVLHV